MDGGNYGDFVSGTDQEEFTSLGWRLLALWVVIATKCLGQGEATWIEGNGPGPFNLFFPTSLDEESTCS